MAGALALWRYARLRRCAHHLLRVPASRVSCRTINIVAVPPRRRGMAPLRSERRASTLFCALRQSCCDVMFVIQSDRVPLCSINSRTSNMVVMVTILYAGTPARCWCCLLLALVTAFKHGTVRRTGMRYSVAAQQYMRGNAHALWNSATVA